MTKWIRVELSPDDFRRLTKIAVEANEAANLKDQQLQRIETALDTELAAYEEEAS